MAFDFGDHHRRIGAGIGGDLAHGRGKRALDDLHASALVTAAAGGQAIKAIGQFQQGAAPAGNDPFLHRGAGGIKGILNS